VIRPVAAGLCVAALFAGTARAELTQTDAHGFTIRHAFTVSAAPDDAYAAMLDIANWWDPEHSYSGDAANFSLQAVAGGCFCETWDAGSTLHAEIIQVRDGAMIRMRGALGPLQEMGLSSLHEWTFEATDTGTQITYVNLVRGWPGDELEALAPIVDAVQVAQMERLRRWIEYGDPGLMAAQTPVQMNEN